MKILFIASIGRSGSTAVEAFLTRYIDNSVGIGESYFMAYPFAFGKCACKVHLRSQDCLWEQISNSSKFASLFRKRFYFYTSILNYCKNKLFATTIIDSSKSINALKFVHSFARASGCELYVVNLKRDVSKVIKSTTCLPSAYHKEYLLIFPRLKLAFRRLLGCRLSLVKYDLWQSIIASYESRIRANYKHFYSELNDYLLRESIASINVELDDNSIEQSLSCFLESHGFMARASNDNWLMFFHNANGNPARFFSSGNLSQKQA